MSKEIQIKKSTAYKVVFAILAILAIYLGVGKITPTTNEQKLSGTLIGLDPQREMAGAGCHYMGGGYMGDCQIREIQLEAKKYDWSEPTITVRSGELIRIQATSKDVTHGITIPDIGFNLVIQPERINTGEFVAPQPGEYTYGCSVMCGPGHHEHTGKLVVI